MTRTIFLIAVAATLFPGPALPGEDEAVAELVFKVEEPRGYPSVSLKPGEAPPEGVAPVENDKGVRYSRRPLGRDAHLLVAAKFWPEPAWIRVDRNFDGKLDDEEAMHFKGSAPGLSITIPVHVLVDGTVTEIPLRFIHHHNPGSHCLHLTIPVKKEGFVVLAGRLRPVAMLDGNADLRFDGKTDGLYLDVDGDTVLKAGAAGRDRVTPGTPFRIGDVGYTAINRPDGRISFQPVEGEPPPPVVVWPKGGTPRAGLKAGTEKTPLPKLARAFEAAGKKDANAGANVFTERSKVLNRIGRIGDDAAFGFLWKTYEKDSNVNVRGAAIRAMGYADYVAHAPQVAGIAANSGPVNLRTAAITALHGMDAPGRRELLTTLVKNANHDSLFSMATRHLAYIATKEDLAMLEGLARTETTALRRRYAYEAATRYRSDPPPADLVRAAASADDPFQRALGLEHAFAIALPDARTLALASFASKQDRVLLQAVRIVGSVGGEGDVAALLGLADASGAVTRDIVRLLRAVRRENSVAALIGALAHGPAAVRRLAAEILAGIPWLSVEEALAARARREKDPAVLAAILRALGVRETADSVSALLAAAEVARGDHESLGAALDALARLGLDRPKVRRFFEKVIASKDPVDRMLALEAAASTGRPDVADLLLEAIEDEDWRVRLVAAEGLGKARVKRAVPILIDRLEDEETPRVRRAVEESLFLVTGQAYYDIVKLWRKWWKESGEDFEVPEEIPKRKPSGHKGASVASFYGVPVNSDRIIFVIDQSGSMSSAAGNMTKLERAVDETLKVVKKLKSRARVNVILFETNIHPWQKKLVRMSGGSKALLARHLRSKRPTGGTNLYDGLEMALLTKDVDTIYLLSDGSPGSGKFVARPDILREVRRLNRTRRVAIHCIAVGFDSPLMKDLAAENSGQYVRR